MKKIKLSVFFFLLFVVNIKAQIYTDYLGAGHNEGISITTSSNESFSTGDNTTDGSGLSPNLYDASRFLIQSTLGADYETIEYVSEIGYATWLDEQLNMPLQVSFLDTTWMIWDHFVDAYSQQWGDTNIIGNDNVLPYSFYWRMAWWNNIMKSEDLVRQRVALALSEIFVISEKSDLDISGPAIAGYYDMLYQNAFGNYRNLLYDVTMNPAMGYYLSHMNNPKSDIANNIHPDENYAREIMQLFSIGLYELNTDGTRVVDNDGNYVLTYDNDDIKEFAKIFTGLAPGQYYWPWEDLSNVIVEWGNWYNSFVGTINMWTPMQMFDNWHEPGQKHLLNNFTVLSGQTGMQDINSAIDNLYNHQNVGPFISRRLIQRLIKSNPSPEYIQRVATVFNNNGSGIRGDLKAVVKAILLDDEAHDCIWLNDPNAGKLSEPLLRYTQLMRAFNAGNNSGRMWNMGYFYQYATHQSVLAAPSVFNFFLPDYQPNGPIADADIFAPEFQIHTSSTLINYYNLIYDMLVNNYYMEVSSIANDAEMNIPEFDWNQLDPDDYVTIDLSDEFALASNPAELVDRLNIILAGGLLSDETLTTITNTIYQLQYTNDETITKAAIYLVLGASDYTIRK